MTFYRLDVGENAQADEKVLGVAMGSGRQADLAAFSLLSWRQKWFA